MVLSNITCLGSARGVLPGSKRNHYVPSHLHPAVCWFLYCCCCLRCHPPTSPRVPKHNPPNRTQKTLSANDRHRGPLSICLGQMHALMSSYGPSSPAVLRSPHRPCTARHRLRRPGPNHVRLRPHSHRHRVVHDRPHCSEPKPGLHSPRSRCCFCCCFGSASPAAVAAPVAFRPLSRSHLRGRSDVSLGHRLW